MRRLLFLVLAIGLAAGPAAAVQPDEILADPALERRARDISSGLRCLVCQNQSIDDSDAPLAKDLRVLVRERLKAGESDTAVQDYIVQRYGEFVLLRPVLGGHTLILWLTPLLVLGVGAAMLLLRLRSRPRAISPLDEAELEGLKRVLSSEPGPGRP